MEQPNVKSRKVYAVIESTVEMPCETLEDFLKANRFTGTQTIAYQSGGVRTVQTEERFPLTVEGLADLRAFLKTLNAD